MVPEKWTMCEDKPNSPERGEGERKKYSKELKSKGALHGMKGDQTADEIASEFGIHVILVNRWKQQAIESLPQVFGSNDAKQDKIAGIERDRLFQKVGYLRIDLDCLKKAVYSNLSYVHERPLFRNMLIPVTDPDPQLKKIGGLPEMIWFDNNFVPADSHELRLVKYHVVVNSIFLKKDTWIEAPGMILLIVLLIRRLMERSGSPPIFFVKDLCAYYRSFLFYVNLISFFGDIYIERGIFLKL